MKKKYLLLTCLLLLISCSDDEEDFESRLPLGSYSFKGPLAITTDSTGGSCPSSGELTLSSTLSSPPQITLPASALPLDLNPFLINPRISTLLPFFYTYAYNVPDVNDDFDPANCAAGYAHEVSVTLVNVSTAIKNLNAISGILTISQVCSDGTLHTLCVGEFVGRRN